VETIEAFYRDPRRQDSREIRFGSGWRSSHFEHFEFVVFWVADTNELCLLRAPIRGVQSDGVLRRFILGLPPHVRTQSLSDEEVTVEVLATLTEEQVERALAGWQDHVQDSGGVEWLREMLSSNFDL
jgi:hypothetical protein